MFVIFRAIIAQIDLVSEENANSTCELESSDDYRAHYHQGYNKSAPHHAVVAK